MFEKNPNLQNLLPQLDLDETHSLRFSPVTVEALDTNAVDQDDNWRLTDDSDGENLIKFWNEVGVDLANSDKIDFES